nr:hypothetical protein BHM03_00030143 [Ipomoea batatas]
MLTPLHLKNHHIISPQSNSDTTSSINAKNPTGASPEDPELPGASAGLVSRAPTAVVGAPAAPTGASAAVLGGEAEGEASGMLGPTASITSLTGIGTSFKHLVQHMKHLIGSYGFENVVEMKSLPLMTKAMSHKVAGKYNLRRVIYSQPQLLTEGAETWQAAGRDKALVTLRTTPNWALFLKPSQRHSALDFSTIFRPEQQVPSGFVVVLPFITKERQSARFRTKLLQSTAGAGAEWWAESAVTAQRVSNPSTTGPNAFKPIAIFDRKGEILSSEL